MLTLVRPWAADPGLAGRDTLGASLASWTLSCQVGTSKAELGRVGTSINCGPPWDGLAWLLWISNQLTTASKRVIDRRPTRCGSPILQIISIQGEVADFHAWCLDLERSSGDHS